MKTFSEIMVEEFNNFLLERKLSIPNFEKVDLDEDIPIYGKDRVYLKDRIDLVVFNIVDSIRGNDNITINDFEATVIDSFEDFLEENGIVIWNEEKHEALEEGMDAEEIANVYGSDYGLLQQSVEYAIENCKEHDELKVLKEILDPRILENEDIDLF